MRVYDRDLTGAAASESGRSQDTVRVDRGTGAAPAPSGNSSGDWVELSSGLASVSHALAAENSERANRIQQLSAQVQDGSYQPSSAVISQGLLTEALSGGSR